MQKRYDFIILGAGLAGMMAAARLQSSGFRILIIEAFPDSYPENELRTTALLLPSIDLLKTIGLYVSLSPYMTPLKTMAITDANATPNIHAHFDAADIQEEAFGYNIQNLTLFKLLREFLKERPLVDFSFEDEMLAFQQNQEYVSVKTNKSKTSARILISAEGRTGKLPSLLNIKPYIKELGQSALIFNAFHEKNHNFISHEVHKTGGPMTNVPMPMMNDRHCSAFIWMHSHENINELNALKDKDFTQKAEQRFGDSLGAFEMASKRAVIPLITRQVPKMLKHRAILIGETAHIIPPIGAQGLNMSIKDIETLARVCERGGLSDPAILKTWERERLLDVHVRMQGVNLLNITSIAASKRIQDFRRWGLKRLSDTDVISKVAIKMGLGRI